MHLYSIISLLPALFSFFLCAYVYAQRRNTAVNNAFIILTFDIFIIHLSDSLRLLCDGPVREFLSSITCVAFFISGALLINFFYRFMRLVNDRIYWFFMISGIIVATIAPFTTMQTVTTLYPGGPEVYTPTASLWPLYLISSVSPAFFVIISLFIRKLDHLLPAERQTVLMFRWGIVFSVVILILTTTILPYFFRLQMASFAMCFATILLLINFYIAIRRYNIFSIDLDHVSATAKTLFHDFNQGVIVFGHDGQCLQINKTACSLCNVSGADTLTAKRLEEQLDGYRFDLDSSEREAIYHGKGPKRTYRFSQSTIHHSTKILGKLVILRDTTEQSQMQCDLSRIRHIEALGHLAGGIAHDFNNYLTGILATLSLLRLNAASEDQRDIIKNAEKSGWSAARLVNQLLTFSRGGAPVLEQVSITQLIEETASFTTHGSKSKVVLEITDDLWPFNADRSQISQVFQNLIINADQSMIHGGTITIRACNYIIKPTDLLSTILAPGRYIMNTICDTGCGIAPDTIDHVFVPYFSTKQDGRGLGLATVHSIIQRHAGYISVTSKENTGTCFTFYIPASDINHHCSQDNDTTISPNQTFKHHVLIMDDDAAVRLTLNKLLSVIGCTVESATEGLEAFEMYCAAKDSAKPFEIIITDLTVPGGIGGAELAQKIRAIDTKIPIIVSSGYSNDPILSNLKEFGFTGAIKKPYGIKDIKKTLGAITAV